MKQTPKWVGVLIAVATAIAAVGGIAGWLLIKWRPNDQVVGHGVKWADGAARPWDGFASALTSIDSVLFREWPDVPSDLYSVEVVPYEANIGVIRQNDGGFPTSKMTGTLKKERDGWVVVVRQLRKGRTREADFNAEDTGPIDSACSSALAHEVFWHRVPAWLGAGQNQAHVPVVGGKNLGELELEAAKACAADPP
jgi:hypothetical protein